MKRFTYILILIAISVSIQAYDFQFGDLYYNITSSSAPYTVEVTYQKYSHSSNYSGLKTANIPETVTYNGITYSVTRIGRYAFDECSSLTSITIPNSVTNIEKHAFYRCSSLTKTNYMGDIASWCDIKFSDYEANPMYYSHNFYINDQEIKDLVIPNTVDSIYDYAFYNCSELTSVTIPNSVTSIGNSAFECCSSLTSMFVEEGNTIYDSRDNSNAIIETATNTLITGCSNTTIPNSVTSIGDYAFSGCSSLTSITIPNSVTSIGSGAFHYCSSLTSITIPESVTSIGHRAFYYCTSLTSVTIPNSVTSIGSSVFYKCSSLTSVTIPNSVTSIRDDAFYNCSSLTSITIPNSVTSIGSSAFNGCRSLTSFAIPNSVTSIGHRAFYYCTSLTSITIPNSVTIIANDAFAYCSSLTSVTIGSGVTSIGVGAFEMCTSLTSIVIPNSVTSIGWNAFRGCSSLTSITIPNSVTSIGGNAFSGCSSLISVDIGNSVTIIGERAFYACSDLDTISIDATTPPSLGSYAFSSAPICYIPCGTKVDYANSSWSDYVDTFEEHLINATSGRYGPNIKWKYNDSKLSLFGTGNISKLDCTPWELVIDSIKEIEIENGITNIPADAFSNYTKLNKITLPSSLEEIGANAFANCRRLYEIYSYASIPPLAEVSSFTNYNATLYVPCEHKQYYQSDMVFSLFNKVECISSEEVEADSVIVVPGANDVTITWLKEDGAETYSIVIKKDGEVVCTLTFNSAGQLINIAFAPGRNGNHPAQYAEQVANGKGYRFTVTGLEEGTHYTYNIDVKNTADQTINSHSGEFTTQSTTAVENIEVSENDNAQKLIRNGQLIIIRNGVEYNAVGQEM